MKCSNPACGRDVAADALFCPYCGTKISAVCSNCGAELVPDAAFCMKCGTRIGQENLQSSGVVGTAAQNIRKDFGDDGDYYEISPDHKRLVFFNKSGVRKFEATVKENSHFTEEIDHIYDFYMLFCEEEDEDKYYCHVILVNEHTNAQFYFEGEPTVNQGTEYGNNLYYIFNTTSSNDVTIFDSNFSIISVIKNIKAPMLFVGEGEGNDILYLSYKIEDNVREYYVVKDLNNNKGVLKAPIIKNSEQPNIARIINGYMLFASRGAVGGFADIYTANGICISRCAADLGRIIDEERQTKCKRLPKSKILLTEERWDSKAKYRILDLKTGEYEDFDYQSDDVFEDKLRREYGYEG